MLKKITQNKLDSILSLNENWVKSKNASKSPASLQNVKIDNLRANNRDFVTMNLNNSVIKNANFFKSSFNRITATNSTFEQCNLFNVAMCGANLSNSEFIKCDMRSINCKFADLSYATFKGTDLRDTKFLCTNLTGVDIDDGTDLHGAILYNVTIDEETRNLIENLNIGASFIYETFYKIVKKIEFPLGYQELGMSLLSHCASIINDKYFHQDVRIKLEQDGLEFKFIVESERGGLIDEVKILLKRYSMLIKNNITPEEFYRDEIKDKELKILRLEKTIGIFKQEVALLRDYLQKNSIRGFAEDFILNIAKQIEE